MDGRMDGWKTDRWALVWKFSTQELARLLQVTEREDGRYLFSKTQRSMTGPPAGLMETTPAPNHLHCLQFRERPGEQSGRSSWWRWSDKGALSFVPKARSTALRASGQICSSTFPQESSDWASSPGLNSNTGSKRVDGVGQV